MGSLSTPSPPKPWKIILNQPKPMKIPPANFSPHKNPRKPISCLAFDPSKIAASSAAPPLVVVGSANADIYVEIDRLPREGETVSAKTGQTLAGGKGANQAVCGGRLRYPTYFVGQIGKDAHGKLIAEALEGGGVSLDYLSAVDGAPTGHAVVMLQANGQNSIIIVGGANMACWPELLDREDLEVVENAGIVLLQREIPDSGVKQVLVKLGAKGSALFTQGKETLKQPIISAPKIIDTTGAGDTFTAAFAVALVEGKSKTECLQFAAAAASLCVQVKGAIPSMPDRDSVLNLLHSTV
ncbi:pfkB-like carbohydrate kinase family protein [Striga hermonthica]|uniref:Ribokinase n=1 Tax=Striga hermonthica TaxID=68872 RepID=A0A9N7R6I5_STRHE|nr:pfkB-like carbohydrate kinase family protein [Striga hermonthica]